MVRVWDYPLPTENVRKVYKNMVTNALQTPYFIRVTLPEIIKGSESKDVVVTWYKLEDNAKVSVKYEMHSPDSDSVQHSTTFDIQTVRKPYLCFLCVLGIEMCV